MTEEHTLIVLGATGDLAGRLLVPALARLALAGQLPDGFRFVGAGPQEWGAQQFRSHLNEKLAAHASDLSAADLGPLVEQFDYRPVDVLDPAAIGRVFGPWLAEGRVTFYLALPTNLIGPTVAALERIGLPSSARVAVEKPFGTDLPTAVALNATLARATAGPASVYRVDHVLGMPAVQNLPTVLAPLIPGPGRRPAIDEVAILWEETLGLEGRAAFYDGAGALKDLLQNPLLQILCIILAAGDSGGTVVTRRLAAMRRIQIPTAAQAVADSRRARYTAGVLTGPGAAGVPDYSAEPGVDPARRTETFAEVTLRVADPRWSGTRFVLRAGKALKDRRRGVLVLSSESDTESARWFDVDERATAERPDSPEVFLSAPTEQLAYVNVLRDLLLGADRLSVSAEESELAWRIFTSVLQEWASGSVPLDEYPAGSAADSVGDRPMSA